MISDDSLTPTVFLTGMRDAGRKAFVMLIIYFFILLLLAFFLSVVTL